MLNMCESCGHHSSQTVYELLTKHELCPPCYVDLMKQRDAVAKRRSSYHEFESTTV